MSTAKPCPSGITDNLGRRVSHPPGTHTGACANWHVEMEQMRWEREAYMTPAEIRRDRDKRRS